MLHPAFILINVLISLTLTAQPKSTYLAHITCLPLHIHSNAI